MSNSTNVSYMSFLFVVCFSMQVFLYTSFSTYLFLCVLATAGALQWIWGGSGQGCVEEELQHWQASLLTFTINLTWCTISHMPYPCGLRLKYASQGFLCFVDKGFTKSFKEAVLLCCGWWAYCSSCNSERRVCFNLSINWTYVFKCVQTLILCLLSYCSIGG